jgi:hypothetical protein
VVHCLAFPSLDTLFTGSRVIAVDSGFSVRKTN